MCDIETPNVSNLEDISSFCGTSCDLLSVPQDVLITSPTPVKFNKEERCYSWSFAKRKTHRRNVPEYLYKYITRKINRWNVPSINKKLC